MGDAKLKKDAVVTLDLAPAERVVLFEALYLVIRCQACQRNVTQAAGPIETIRHAELIRALKLDELETQTAQDRDRALGQMIPREPYSLKLELARHLQMNVEAKGRYIAHAHLLASVAAQLYEKVPKKAAELDEERVSSSTPPPWYTFTVSVKERLATFEAFNNPVVCVACGNITDGPDKREKFLLHAACWSAMRLGQFPGAAVADVNQQIAEDEARPQDEWTAYTLNREEALYLHELLGRRCGHMVRGPLRLSRLLGILEEIKACTREADKAPITQDGDATPQGIPVRAQASA